MNKTPWIIAILVVLYIAFTVASQEYTRIMSALGETQSKANAVADETRETIASIRQTIEDLRGKFRLLETQLAAAEGASEAKPIVRRSTVVMHSASWCGSCKVWLRDAAPAWRKQGWQVEIIEDDSTTRSVPWFEVNLSDGRRFEINEYLTQSAYEKALRNGQ